MKKGKQSPGHVFRQHYVSMFFTTAYVIGGLSFLIPENYHFYELQTHAQNWFTVLFSLPFSMAIAISFSLTKNVTLTAGIFFLFSFLISLVIELIWKLPKSIGKVFLVLGTPVCLVFGAFTAPRPANLDSRDCSKELEFDNKMYKIETFDRGLFDPHYVTFMLASGDGENWEQEHIVHNFFGLPADMCANFKKSEFGLVFLHDNILITKSRYHMEWLEQNLENTDSSCQIEEFGFQDMSNGEIRMSCLYYVYLYEVGTSVNIKRYYEYNTFDGGANWRKVR